MKLFLSALCLLIAFMALSQNSKFNYQKDYQNILAETQKPSSNIYYSKLVNRFKANDTTLTDHEVLCLLIGFTTNEHYKPYDYLDTEREIYSLNGNGKFLEAKQMCDSFLTDVPLSQKALIEKSYSFYKLGQLDSASYYRWQFKRIMEAMAYSGDGLTPETAFFALGPADGQNFIVKFLSGKIGSMASGRDNKGNFVDILGVVITDEKTGETTKRPLYFQIEHAVKKMFGGEDLKMIEDAFKKDKGKKKKKKTK